MKKLPLPLLLVATLLLSASLHAQDKNFWVFLCLGQSNMEGFPGVPDADKAYSDPRFQVLAAVDFPELHREQGHWYPATPPLCRPNSGVCPADFFGRTLVEHVPAGVRIGVVNVSVAGCKIEVFDPDRLPAYAAGAPPWMKGIIATYGGNPYQRLVALAREAQKTGVIRGILLHQGEGNTNDATWPAQVKALYERLLGDLGLDARDVPLLAGEVVGADQHGACASMNTIIDDLPKTIPTAHVISSAGCACRPDRLHFLPEGYRELGRRYAEAMLPLLGVPAGDRLIFTNPPLAADYPDPDIIRVGDDFYFATTTFANSPGMRLLHSRDLVHWEIVGHVIPRLDGRPEYDLDGGNAYRYGIYAPSLRHRGDTFYLAVTPVKQNTRIYYAKDPAGPWQYHELDRAAFDPALVIEPDGSAFIVTSGGWDGTGTLLTLDADLAHIVSSEKIFFIKGAEGSKIIHRGDWFYLFNSIPSRLGLTVSRAHGLRGPWETRPQIDDTTGGHQGALVDLPDGSWYGFVMRDAGAIGRVTNLSPVFWQDDWPVWGTPAAPNRVPATAPYPLGFSFERWPATSDDFSSPQLGRQWEWNHNPDDARWSLTERPGFLRLHPTRANDLWSARNTLTQKGQGPVSSAIVKLELENLKPDTVCGFGTFGKISGYIAVHTVADGHSFLRMEVRNDAVGSEMRMASRPVSGAQIQLRTQMDFNRSIGRCDFSLDGQSWENLGGDFPLMFDWRTGTFQGEQYAVFCFSPTQADGYVDVDLFQLTAERRN